MSHRRPCSKESNTRNVFLTRQIIGHFDLASSCVYRHRKCCAVVMECGHDIVVQVVYTSVLFSEDLIFPALAPAVLTGLCFSA